MSLTIKDEKRIREIFKEEFPDAFKAAFEDTGTTRRLNALADYLFNHTASKAELEELKEKINLLPTKDEFFTAMDTLLLQIAR